MKKVLQKVCNSKAQQQLTEAPPPSFVEKLKQKTKRDKDKDEQPPGTTEVTVHSNVTERRGSFSFLDRILPRKKEKEDAPEKGKLLTDGGEASEPQDA